MRRRSTECRGCHDKTGDTRELFGSGLIEFARQPLDHPSKRIEKRDELLLLRLGQIEKAVGDVLGLAFVPLDRVLKG